MEEQVHDSEREDRDVDPIVIAKRTKLYNQYVVPYYNMIYKLVMQYSWNPANVKENYNEVLVNFYRGIETYDSTRSIKTWLHIVTKRCVYELERKRLKYDNRDDDNDLAAFEDEVGTSEKSTANAMSIDNYRDFYNDDILWVLDQMKPIHRDAILLQEAGYSLKEIADIEYNKGTLKSHNIDTVKSRLYLARQFMKRCLTRDGKCKLDK